MPFRLTYNGRLTANGNAAEKHELRRHFHIQLKRLWDQEPLLSYKNNGYLQCEEPLGKVIHPLDGIHYACIVTEKLQLHCELDILFLRPCPPGSIIRTGGDIDNRLKTLFDGLRRPLQKGEISGSAIDDTPFHCLLSEDSLISKIGVTTDQLLEPDTPEGNVKLVIAVTVVAHDVNKHNFGYLR